jgi:uncharacterized protein (DUF305 family)
MYNKARFLITLTLSLYFFSSCNNNTATNTDKTDTATTRSAQSDTANTKMNMSDTMKMDNGLMSSMNTMMDKITNMRMTGDFDADFANMMIEHDQGAIDMAQMEISKGADEKIKTMAQNILTMQTEEQSKLKDLVKNLNAPARKSDSSQKHYELQATMENMMNKMKGMQMTGNTDKDFIMTMIPLHESAIEMAKFELSNGKNRQFKEMAQKGITDKTKEISELKAWLNMNR